MTLTRPFVFGYLAIVASTGCTNFQHPLPWEHSSIHESVVGEWQSIEDAATHMKVDIKKNENGSLLVEIYLDDLGSGDGANSEANLPFSSRASYVSFEGEVLGSSDLHVLQIDMASYDERDDKDEAIDGKHLKGYRFVRVLPTEKQLELRLVDVRSFSRLAEHALANEESMLSIKEFSDCLEGDASAFLILDAIREGVEQGEISLSSEIDLAEFMRLEENLRNHELVNPYEELQKMRACIAYKLPGAVLGRLFELNPEGSFNGESIQLSRGS